MAPLLASVPPEQLARMGMQLSAPETTSPPIPAWRAREIVTTTPPPTVREVVLADLTMTTVANVNHRLCWIVSIIPAGGFQRIGPVLPGQPTPGIASVDLIVIDANTGATLFETVN